MKNIKRKIITIIFVLTLAMCGCGTGNTDKSADDPTEDNVYRVVFPSNAVSFCNKGVCKLESGIANFWDAETKQSVVLCSKPNCSHTKRQASGESCDAFLGNRVDLFFMNGQNIYYICEMGSGNDGLGSIFDRKMVKADLNGKNRKTIFEFENIQEVGGINNAYCSEDCFAFAYCVSDSREKPEDDIVLGKLEKRKAGVYLVNLETEEKKLINEIEEYGAYVYFVYIDDGKVYYVLSYRTEYLDYSDTNVKEGNYDKSIHRYDFCSYDIETGENKTIRSFNGSEITFFSQPSGGYYIFENETECIFYKNGKEVAKYTIDKLAEHDPPYINKYVYNDTLYMTDTEKVWCMDIVTGKIQYLGNGKLDNKYIGTIDAMINGLVYYNIWDPETWKNTSYVIEYKDFIDGNIENSTEVSFKR